MNSSRITGSKQARAHCLPEHPPAHLLHGFRASVFQQDISVSGCQDALGSVYQDDMVPRHYDDRVQVCHGVMLCGTLNAILECCWHAWKLTCWKSGMAASWWRASFKKWNKSTSTSPSGRHLGFHQAVMVMDQVAAGMCKMLNIITRTGLVPRH